MLARWGCLVAEATQAERGDGAYDFLVAFFGFGLLFDYQRTAVPG